MVEVFDKKGLFFNFREINMRPRSVLTCGLNLLSKRAGLKLTSRQTWDHRCICTYQDIYVQFLFTACASNKLNRE